MKYLAIFIIAVLAVGGSPFKKSSPPGTIAADRHGLQYIDKQPIGFIDWIEMQYWLKNRGFDSAYAAVMPNWDAVSKFYGAKAGRDSMMLMISNVPVVGVSKQQIEFYCKWRGEVVSKINVAHGRPRVSYSPLTYGVLSKAQAFTKGRLAFAEIPEFVAGKPLTQQFLSIEKADSAIGTFRCQAYYLPAAETSGR